MAGFSIDGIVTDADDLPVKGARVYVYDTETGLAALHDDLGAPVENPRTTNAAGYWSAFVDDQGYYTLKTLYGGRERRVEIIIVGQDPLERAEQAADTAEAFAGPTFPDVASGLAATEDGEQFAVNDDGIVTIYLNDGGSAVVVRDLATASALASNDPGKGAALVGAEGSGTVQDALDGLTPFIWRKLPTLETGAAAGTPTQNAARWQAQADALHAMGGGILKVNEGTTDIDRPVILRPKVSVEGPGKGRALVTNSASYDFRQSAIFMTGNFHPAQTQAMLGDGNSKALNAVTLGAQAVTASTAGDVAGYAPGDMVIVFDSAFYTSSGFKVFQYMAARKVVSVSSGTVTLDAPLRAAITSGYIYNLRTGTLLGAPSVAGDPGLPLYVWHDAEIAGLSLSTPGYWMADSATWNARYSDLEIVRSRALAYGNTFQNTVFDGIEGKFGITGAELSLNSENTIVRNFRGAWDSSMGLTPTVGLTVQENGFDVTYRDGLLDVTGWTASQDVFRCMNAVRARFEGVKGRHGGASFTGNVVAVGDTAPAAGRQANVDASVGIDWSGPCARYVFVTGSNTSGAIFDGYYRGTPSSNEAFRFGQAGNNPTSRNAIASTCRMESGRGTFVTGCTGQEVIGAFVGGGMAALSTTDYTTLTTNNVRGIRTNNSAARRGGTSAMAVSYTVTTSDADVLSCPVGNSTLQRQDEITFFVRINCSAGTAGTKTIYFRMVDTVTPTNYTLATVVIPAATTGFVEISGRVFASAANLWSPEVRCSDAGATITKAEITTDLTNKTMALRLAAIKAAGGDTATIRAATIALNNPVQN